jgi:hypothetical protein
MYPDVLGKVTTGEGDLIDSIADAQALPWQNPDGTLTSAAEVASAWTIVKNCGLEALGGMSAQVQALTTIRLTAEAVAALVRNKLLSNEKILAAHFGDAYTFAPADAQLGLHSVAWACGPAAITEPGLHHFPLFAAAFAASDWTTCAVQVEMSAQDNPDNNLIRRNTLDRTLFLAAARVVEQGLDPDVLHYQDE